MSTLRNDGNGTGAVQNMALHNNVSIGSTLLITIFGQNLGILDITTEKIGWKSVLDVVED